MKTLIIFLFAGLLFPVSINADWETELTQTYNDFVNCSNASSEECEAYTFKALDDVYRLKKAREFKNNDAFYAWLEGEKSWTILGQAYNQAILTKAQSLANNGKAVVAVYVNSENQPLHIATILPGDLSPSGSWGLNVPNAASFPDFNPENAFINKPLSYAFEKKALLKIKLYTLN